jgi:hypothetical protein
MCSHLLLELQKIIPVTIGNSKTGDTLIAVNKLNVIWRMIELAG